MKRRIVILGIALVFIALIVVLSITSARRETGTLVQTDEVERVPSLISKVTSTGEIKPKEFVEIQAETTGIITQLFVREGDLVQQGDLLLKIDPKQLELQAVAERASYDISVAEAENQKAQIRVQETVLERDRASVRKSEAELSRLRQSHEIAKRSFDRKQQMFEDNLISRDTYDAAKNELINAEAALTTAGLSLEQSKAQLAVTEVGLEQERTRYRNTLKRIEQSQANLDRREDEFAKTVIRSPLSGVITQMNVEVGERAVPGTLNNPSATLMVIADLSVIEAEVEVDETDIVNVRVGQEAEVQVDAVPNRKLTGRITEIGSSAIPTSNSQEAKDFKVVIQLDDPPSVLRPGLSCTAEITTGRKETVLAIPIQALTVREYVLHESGELIREEANGEKKGDSKPKVEKQEIEGAFKIVGDRRVEFVKVETGIVGETKIEVLSGLSEGDRIVSGSYKALRSLKDRDRIREEKEKEGN